MTPTRRATDAEQVLNLLPARFDDWYLVSKTRSDVALLGATSTFRSRSEKSFRALVNVAPSAGTHESKDNLRPIDIEINAVLRTLIEQTPGLDLADIRRRGDFITAEGQPGKVGVMIFAEPSGRHEALTFADSRAFVVKIRAAWTGVIGIAHYEVFVRSVAKVFDLFTSSGLI